MRLEGGGGPEFWGGGADVIEALSVHIFAAMLLSMRPIESIAK
jgi:hypothetical protein